MTVKTVPTYQMERSYEGLTTLNTTDLLTAIRKTCNYEADLYANGSLIMSCLGLSREDNTRRLLKMGVTSYVSNKSWTYRYTDPAKQVSKYYVDFNSYDWNGKPTIDFRVNDYQTRSDNVEFDSLGKVFEGIRRHIEQFTFNEVHVSIWDSQLGYQSVYKEDWMTEGEPVIYQLLKNGELEEFGFHHGIQDKLARNIKYGWDGEWSVQPYTPPVMDGKQHGDVVFANLPVALGFKPNQLFLIDKIEGEIYTLRDLDDYKETVAATVADLIVPADRPDLL